MFPNQATSIMHTGSADRFNNAVAAQNMSLYERVRQEGDVDLVDECRKLLHAAGLGPAATAFYDTHHCVINAAPLTTVAQEYLLNHYWRLQLANSPGDTQNERGALIGNLPASEWLSLFSRYVVPALIARNLPTSLFPTAKPQ